MALLFAITREDYRLEQALIENFYLQEQQILCVGSGGCTPLSLRSCFPELKIDVFDFNPDQIKHIQQKQIAIENGNIPEINLLNQKGEFESLFRILRTTWLEFLCSEHELKQYFDVQTSHEERMNLVQKWTTNKYWLAPFHCSMNDAFLHQMFTSKATQHAGPNSYPPYFSKVIHNGLLQQEGYKNPFLQHILLGSFIDKDAPPYYQAHQKLPLQYIVGSIAELPSLHQTRLISLSNILDWSDPENVETWMTKLQEVPSGSIILIRQLNNTFNWDPFFSPYFTRLDSTKYQHIDRSLFYNQIRLYQRGS
jgi:S-adenosylmethionine-diacylglycerol 3-amino-3-carboxypropyl transferase